MIQTIILTLVVIFGTRLLFNWFLNSFRDVPMLYLDQQLFASPTRFENESPIYRSIKCDDPETAPRVGLDIRYNHYKLRHGNLCDIWLLAVANSSVNSHTKIQFEQDLYLILQINSLVYQYIDLLSTKDSVIIPSRLWLRTPALFAMMIAAFVTQTTVELYDSGIVPLANGNPIHVFDSGTSNGPFAHINAYEQPQGSSSEFENEYHPEKDKGTALRFSHQVSPSLVSTADFTQLNLVSATASTLRHLPQSYAFSSKDLLLIVLGNENSNDLVGSLIKVLAALVSGSSICFTDLSITWSQLKQLDPSIVLALASNFDRVIAEISDSANPLLVNQLSRGIFWTSNVAGKGIRLVYLQQPITEPQHKTPLQLNQIRILLGARLIYERFNYTVAGPILLTDFFDYRVHNVSCRGSGALSQSLEFKLRDLGPDQKGRVFIRGYNIGKMKQLTDHHLDQGPFENKNMDGFMPLNVMGQWGADGCLYIF